MTAACYRQYRLAKEQYWSIAKASEHQDQANKLRIFALGFGIPAAIVGILGAINGLSFLTAGAGAGTIIAASIAAWGALDRQSFLPASCAGMADALGRLLGRYDARVLSDKQLGGGREPAVGRVPRLGSSHGHPWAVAWAQAQTFFPAQLGRVPLLGELTSAGSGHRLYSWQPIKAPEMLSHEVFLRDAGFTAAGTLGGYAAEWDAQPDWANSKDGEIRQPIAAALLRRYPIPVVPAVIPRRQGPSP